MEGPADAGVIAEDGTGDPGDEEIYGECAAEEEAALTGVYRNVVGRCDEVADGGGEEHGEKEGDRGARGKAR